MVKVAVKFGERLKHAYDHEQDGWMPPELVEPNQPARPVEIQGFLDGVRSLERLRIAFYLSRALGKEEFPYDGRLWVPDFVVVTKPSEPRAELVIPREPKVLHEVGVWHLSSIVDMAPPVQNSVASGDEPAMWSVTDLATNGHVYCHSVSLDANTGAASEQTGLEPVPTDNSISMRGRWEFDRTIEDGLLGLAWRARIHPSVFR